VSQSLDELPEFLTVMQAADVLGLGRTLAYREARRYLASGGRDGLPVVRFGRLLRVPKAALVRLASPECWTRSTGA
jgi:hypothetical protein